MNEEARVVADIYGSSVKKTLFPCIIYSLLECRLSRKWSRGLRVVPGNCRRSFIATVSERGNAGTKERVLTAHKAQHRVRSGYLHRCARLASDSGRVYVPYVHAGRTDEIAQSGVYGILPPVAVFCYARCTERLHLNATTRIERRERARPNARIASQACRVPWQTVRIQSLLRVQILREMVIMNIFVPLYIVIPEGGALADPTVQNNHVCIIRCARLCVLDAA